MRRAAHGDRRCDILRSGRRAGYHDDALHQAGLNEDIGAHLPAADEADAHWSAPPMALLKRFLKRGAKDMSCAQMRDSDQAMRRNLAWRATGWHGWECLSRARSLVEGWIGYSSPIATRLALPPAAAVLMLTTCSVAKRIR
jgi:hypothetical protein